MDSDRFSYSNQRPNLQRPNPNSTSQDEPNLESSPNTSNQGWDFSLRDLIRRIDFKKSAIVVTVGSILYYLATNDISCRIKIPTFRLPDISIIPLHSSNPLVGIVALAMVLITLIALAKIWSQKKK